LTCMMCQTRCPSDINYIRFTKLLRADAKNSGKDAQCSHGGAIQSLMKIMTSPKLNQNRLEWLTPDLKTKENSEYLYFVGCLPYFDLFFSDIKANSLETARSTIKILNFFGIEPKLLANERCCGHDLLWTGDFENFKMLAQHNLAEIKKSGIKKMITSCPECLTCFRLDYPEFFGKLDFEVIHITEFLSDKISQEKVRMKPLKRKVTYQDPCRLGRFLNIFEKPRMIIKSIPEIEFSEMTRSGKNSICCGTNSWINCDKFSKLIQVQRLKEAKSTGAEVLITACPKCQIHFSCAQNDVNFPKEDKLEILDLTTIFKEAIGG
jgi:heterodisulfide reductase subunit D